MSSTLTLRRRALLRRTVIGGSCLLWAALVATRAGAVTAVPCAGAAADLPQLHVVGTGARRVAGNITFTLYGPDPALFLHRGGSLDVQHVTLAGAQAEACFAVSSPGTYAVAIYHDENDNHHFDRNFLGLPAEGYGFSNNAVPVFAPPHYLAAAFAVHPGSNHISIRLRY
ncbi:DUF2141 domain-containing protein [Lichenicoccus roseus]|uniref:DUF2141 domain-containing protein n=1 Tax=Lichenicoccus roseus TaxID=2683649 RepID=A0A5R9JB54_9PROT|nr:DUF2141 domain-containing protein [Lichenicoccus roseus]TLU72616.1 DUF2141 domain-containing protein [Lichenicoccus roseus]